MKKNKKYLILFPVVLVLLLNAWTCLAAVEVPLPGLPENPKLPDYIKSFLQLLLIVGGILAVLVVVVGGIRYMSAAGNPENVTKGTDMVKGGILGLALLLSSWIIINSINPSLTTIEQHELPQLPGLLLVGGKEPAPAPAAISSVAKLKENYSGIQWQETSTDINGDTITNCDVYSLPYIIYEFPNEGLDWPSDNSAVGQSLLFCGDTYNIGPGKSLYIVQATPGIYFYDNDHCLADITTGIPTPYTSNVNDAITIFKTGKARYIQSFQVVNGTDESEGPFYGAIFWGYPHYDGSYIHREAQTKTGFGNCQKIPDAGASITIYRRLGLTGGNSSGEGVELYTEPNYSGGVYPISDKDIVARGIYISQLKGLPPDFSRANVPIERQKLCPSFSNEKDYCLQSVRIYGDYIVILSEGSPDLSSFQNGKTFSEQLTGQLFPSPVASKEESSKYQQYSASDGPIDLNLDWIAPFGINFIEIIPLANPLY